MKYILIGGSGFIGSHFSEKLGESILVNYDINSPDFSDEKYTELNILDKEKFLSQRLKINKKTTLIHLAAVHFDFQKKFYETNVDGTRNVLNFVEKNNIEVFVFFSSVAIYGNSFKGKDENSPKFPINDYGKSKFEAEKIIKEWSKENPWCKVIIIRPAVVFGEKNFGNVYNLISQIKSKFYAIIGSGKNIKSIAYVKNVVDSVLFSIDNIENMYFEYNYSDYPQITTGELSKKICDILSIRYPFKIPLTLTYLITFPIDILEKIFKRDMKFNSIRVKKFTDSTYFLSKKIRDNGFVPSFNIDKSLSNTIYWMSNNNVKKLRADWYSKAKKL